MLARVAGELYWLGRHVERAEHTARLLHHQLAGLADRPASELALGWQVLYRALKQSPSDISVKRPDELEAFLMADAYTLAGPLVEERSNPSSVISCFAKARENARQVRPYLPLSVWSCLNQGHLWMEACDFATTWAKAPSAIVEEISDRLRLFAGVVEGQMPRDQGWHFLELGRFLERLQNQTTLFSAWEASLFPWDKLLRICGAYEAYCRSHSMEVCREKAFGPLVQDPSLPRSLGFCLREIQGLLKGINPKAPRFPSPLACRLVLHLISTVEMANPAQDAAQDFLSAVEKSAHSLHDVVMKNYVDYLPKEGPDL
ncbi:MAG: alpha-E domain-containing protein [Bacteriovoracales bacterium]|nr:alpha-E domain-containing protein [Bacteriovoracales bacterium]